MYPLRTSWSFWLAVPDALLMNSPHPRRSSLFPESSQSRWGAGDGVGPEFPHRGLVPLSPQGPWQTFPHRTGTDGQIAQSWEAPRALHTAPGCGHGYPSNLSCPRRRGRGQGCSGGWVSRSLTGLSFVSVIHMRQRTPATINPSLPPGHPGALGLASLTPQQRGRAWTLFPRQRTTGSQTWEQAPCCLAPTRIRVAEPPLSLSPTTAVPLPRDPPTSLSVGSVPSLSPSRHTAYSKPFRPVGGSHLVLRRRLFGAWSPVREPGAERAVG